MANRIQPKHARLPGRHRAPRDWAKAGRITVALGRAANTAWEVYDFLQGAGLF